MSTILFRRPQLQSILPLPNRQYEAMKVLLRNGAKLENEDDEGNTILIKAILSGKPDVVDFLLKIRANPNHSSRTGDTPYIAPFSRITWKLSGFCLIEALSQAQKALKAFLLYCTASRMRMLISRSSFTTVLRDWMNTAWHHSILSSSQSQETSERLFSGFSKMVPTQDVPTTMGKRRCT